MKANTQRTKCAPIKWLSVHVFLSATGIVITDYFPQYSNRYWIAIVIAFAVACVILEWSHARNDCTKWTTIVGILLLLWVGLIHAISIVFILQHTGELSR